jgi:hypothetical protein
MLLSPLHSRSSLLFTFFLCSYHETSSDSSVKTRILIHYYTIYQDVLTFRATVRISVWIEPVRPRKVYLIARYTFESLTASAQTLILPPSTLYPPSPNAATHTTPYNPPPHAPHRNRTSHHPHTPSPAPDTETPETRRTSCPRRRCPGRRIRARSRACTGP